MRLELNAVECSERLRGYGVNPTAPRIAIYRYLAAHPVHPTADTVYRELASDHPTLSRTTVYNTMKTLLEHRAIQSVIIEDGELRFDADTSVHGHFKCNCCGEVFDFELPAGRPLPEPPPGFAVEETYFCCRGRCPMCAAAAGGRKTFGNRE